MLGSFHTLPVSYSHGFCECPFQTSGSTWGGVCVFVPFGIVDELKFLRGEGRTLVKEPIIPVLARRAISSKVSGNNTLFSQVTERDAVCSMVGHLHWELDLPSSGKQQRFFENKVLDSMKEKDSAEFAFLCWTYYAYYNVLWVSSCCHE